MTSVLLIKLEGKPLNDKFYACVCYLLPASRQTDVQNFYDNLLAGIFMFQTDGLFFICGYLNRRIGDNYDYIVGVDFLPERNIIS